MRRGLLLLLVSMNSCVMQNTMHSSTENQGYVRLSFQNCASEPGFAFIELSPPPGYKLNKSEDHGFCEYQFIYKDQAIFYVSDNIYFGSKLNHENRFNAGIETYSKNRSENDSIKSCGIEPDANFWLEAINGNHVVGYVNSSDSLKFIEALKSVRLIFP